MKLGAAVHLVARSEEKLTVVRDWIRRAAKEDPTLAAVPPVTASAVDLGSSEGIARMVREAGDDLPLSWLQSLGLGRQPAKPSTPSTAPSPEPRAPATNRAALRGCDHHATTSIPGTEKAALPWMRERPPTCIKHGRDDRI
ncbi:hypothetical protein ACFQ7Z_27220 [Streptomyces virginiae]|uniref:hypothetical protein n=1 Tax=Streptomyces virginiae TaxID=1961 RepID=UPI0036B06AB8